MREIEDYLHLYLGCKIVDSRYPDSKPATIHYITKVGGVVIGRSDEFIKLKNWHKIILRPLSSMTEEELQECGNMVYEDFEIGLAPEQFYWLLKKHFDLFGLIESGLAISETSIKATT